MEAKLDLTNIEESMIESKVEMTEGNATGKSRATREIVNPREEKVELATPCFQTQMSNTIKNAYSNQSGLPTPTAGVVPEERMSHGKLPTNESISST